MTRSTGSERARRINDALELIDAKESGSPAAEALAERHGISKRQAYRYLREAKAVGGKVAVPDSKRAFTVRVSSSLAARVRGYAKATGLSLSEVVAKALEAFLAKRGGRG